MIQDDAKTAFNARAKASMQVYLKSRTWPEKIRSIERMNEACKLAREAMKERVTKALLVKGETEIPASEADVIVSEKDGKGARLRDAEVYL